MQYGQSKIVNPSILYNNFYSTFNENENKFYFFKVLEYLLFCCLSMENSIPLLGVKYLTWRSTLYAVTCECFYDCRYNDEGEVNTTLFISNTIIPNDTYL